MTEYVMVPKVPTITNEMKARFIGEFSWKEDAPYYDCHGEVHEYVAAHTVPWDLCKTIFKQMYAEFVAAAPQQAAEPVYFIRDKGASKWLEVAETAYRAALAMPSLCETRILYAGHPPAQPEQPAPIPTCERLPTEADADYSGAVFAFTAFTKEWVLQHWAHVADCPNAYLYWQKTGLTLPAAPGGE